MGGKAHHPSSSESDYWGDESWTVDCPCGVSFDDGEEMVECDECGVWVHTACCRVPKGLTTFVCDKCKGKKKKESEEAPEAPQPSPQRASPQAAAAAAAAEGLHPPDLLRKPANEVPMHERVHVQGLPGGDPSLFVDVPRVFSQQLWKFTGYVPKAFHTKCNDIPPLPSQDDAPERLLALLSSKKEVSVETREEGKSLERAKEEGTGNVKKGTMITLHMEKHKRKVEGGKHGKPGHKSSRSSREAKMQLHVKRGSEDLKRGSEDVKRGFEDLKRGAEDLKRGSEDQNRKESFNKRMRTGSSVKTEEEQSKEDEVSRSGGEPVARGQSPVFSVKNPKAMKKMAVQEFMNRHVSALSNRCLNSEQIQLNFT